MRKIIFIIMILVFGIFSSSSAGKKGTIAFGAKFNTPQVFSFSATTYPYHLWLIQVEPGIGGGKLNIGLGANWRYKIGAAIKASILKTWGHSIGGVKSDQTYVGGEVELMWQGVNMSLGLYSHVAGDNANRDMIFSAGVGIGF